MIERGREGQVHGGENRDREVPREKAALVFLAGMTALFIIPAFFQAAAPPYVRDSLVYHLFCPSEYLKAGTLLHIQGNFYSAFPKGQEMLMTVLLAIAGDRAAQGFSILQYFATAGAVYGLARLVAGPWPAVVTTLLCATAPPVVYFAGCGYVEPALMMTLSCSLLATTFVLRLTGNVAAGEPVGVRESFFLGFLAGWMMTIKYTGLLYSGFIGIILLLNQKKGSRRGVLRSAGAFAVAAVPGLSWMVWNWVALGNPVYPMAGGTFGGAGWDDSKARALSIYFDLFGMGTGFRDYLLLPWRLAFSGQFDSLHFDGAMGPLLLALLAGAVASATPSIRKQFGDKLPSGIGLAGLASAAFFMFGTQQARFWLPTQILLSVYSIPAVHLALTWAKKRRGIQVALILVLAGSLAWNLNFLAKQFFRVSYYRPVLGFEREQDFLMRRIAGYPAIEFMNTHLPPSSRVLCVWTGSYAYYWKIPCYSDSFLEDLTLKSFIDSSKDGKELSRRLTEARFSHLFVRLSLLRGNLDPRQSEIFRDFADQKEVFRFKDYAILSTS